MVDKKLLVRELEAKMEDATQKDVYEALKSLKESVLNGMFDVKVWEYYD